MLGLSTRNYSKAVREFAEALLHARGEWDDLVDEYCRQRGS